MREEGRGWEDLARQVDPGPEAPTESSRDRRVLGAGVQASCCCQSCHMNVIYGVTTAQVGTLQCHAPSLCNTWANPCQGRKEAVLRMAWATMRVG